MIHDLGTWKENDLPVFDLCIVGSGPAGMTVASELASSGMRICVLESGKEKPTRTGDRLREVESQGIRIKDYSRERVLGGSSSTWSGLSSPLDPIDLRPRSFLRFSGWPISRETLLPFYEQAAERYRFPGLPLYGPGGFDKVKEKGDFNLSWNEVEEKVFLAAAEAQHFGREHKQIFDRPEVDCFLDATVIRLEKEESREQVSAAVIRTSQGAEHRLSARAFVLATGGIENARLLLNSNGLGNETDQVGRYLMNHPKNYHGTIHLKQPVRELPYYLGCMVEGAAGYAGLRVKESLQEENGWLNAYVRFEPLYPWSGNPGVESLVLLAKQCKGFIQAWKKRKQGKIVSIRDYSETGDDTELQNKRKSALSWFWVGLLILGNLPWVLRYLYYRLFEKAEVKVTSIRLRNFMEMEADPENRVLLGEEQDPYGQPITRVRHQCTERDRASLLGLHRVLGREVEENGLGRLESQLDSHLDN